MRELRDEYKFTAHSPYERDAPTDRRIPRRTGWKHTDNVKLHYKQFLDDFVKTQAANGGELCAVRW